MSSLKHRRDSKAPIGSWQLAIGNEFAPGANVWPNELSRREFLRLSGATLALAGVGACTKQPIEKLVPFAKQPPEMTPGKPLHFASATTFHGYAQGIIVTSREGRPVKIEGNPDHPASLGATTIWAQADLLDLYDPDRAKNVMRGGDKSTWEDFLRDVDLALQAQPPTGGAGIRILTEPFTSPTLQAQLQALLQKFPDAKVHVWNPIAPDESAAVYDFTQAKVIVALDSDFLFMHPHAVRYARDFGATRRAAEGATMSRLYVAEPTPTITGSNADHRIAVAARDIRAIAEAIARGTGILPREQPTVSSSGLESWIRVAAEDLLTNRSSSIVIVGEMQPPEVHDLVARINEQLGSTIVRAGVAASLSRGVAGTATERRGYNSSESLRQLVEEMRSGAVELLLILGGNPVYDAPVDFDFAGALRKVRMSVHHVLHQNETSTSCHWLIPATHLLESWSDAVGFDRSVSIVQPLIEPLYRNISVHEMIGALVERPVRSGYEIVREFWRARNPTPRFEIDWRRALSEGVFHDAVGWIESSALDAKNNGGEAASKLPPPAERPVHLEVLFRADPNVLDGRYANNGWLQELPRPFTKLTWDNAALISPALAAREKIDNGDVVELEFRGRKLKAPVWIQPGQAENSVTLHLGYGRSEVGRVGKVVGFKAYAIRPSDALWFGDGLIIRNAGEKRSFATTQRHHQLEGRDLLRTGTVAQFVADPKSIGRAEQEPKRDETLYQPNEFENGGYAWGMVVDLGACIGCSACTIACQAENNIPVVGKEQVALGREMHWIRVDTYSLGKEEDPRFAHQPVPCMHCEHAPCEIVCPVAATVHDDEGLNLQVYNRCIGTRYCSNNCPYKVRRFNFLELNGALSPTEKLVKNPNVTVRSRGVMEKCTYCIQRINAARITAELENRQIRDGEVVPACAQVCPTQAIVFGNIHDPNSRVSNLKRSPLNYAMLAELNTRPRTTYLAKIQNPNEALKI
jgi:Fe-S-cluster-containing dehydrogenase component